MDVPETFREAMTQLKKLGRRNDEVGEIAKSILRLLEQARTDIEADMAQAVQARTSQRAKVQITYAVETTAAGETLAERREGGTAQPFRCPKNIYDAMVKALAATEKSLALDEIMTLVKEETGDRPADHQVRVPLRLMLHVDPALIVRHRARYRAASPSSFHADSRRLWDRLRART